MRTAESTYAIVGSVPPPDVVALSFGEVVPPPEVVALSFGELTILFYSFQ